MDVAPFLSRLLVWCRAMRLHQWLKNLLLFAPLALGHQYANRSALITVAVGFVIVGLVASGTYILNDLADLENDRAHASKRNRPFASGALSVGEGVVAAAVLIGGGLAASFLLNTKFGVMLSCYLVLTLSYSFWLKRVALLDVAILGALYTVRLGMGGALADVRLSEWLMVFAAFFFFSLSLSKRTAEISQKKRVLQGPIPGRGYHTDDLFVTMSFGIAATACAILILVLYLMFGLFPSGHYAAPEFLWLAPIAVSLWTMRIWLLAGRGELDEDPVAFAARDPFSLVLGIVAMVGFVSAIGR